MLMYNHVMIGDVSQLLARWSEGDEAALEELTPIVYNELRKLGRTYLGQRSGDVVLQPTMLVHETWVKLAAKKELELNSRSQFYGLAAKIMRDILVDHARRQRADKRGGSQVLLTLNETVTAAAARERPLDILVLEEALHRLAEIKPRYGQLVELKFFAGLTIDQAAEVMKVSPATLERDWNFTRAWLRRELAA